jgi:NAD(P)-dependent dehydrogenase (short-subunit alcohol dehydrogenase family)
MSTRTINRGSLALAIKVTVALVGALLAIAPRPELDWDGGVIPSANEYAKGLDLTVDDPGAPLKGVRIVVTGATSGIGLGASRRLHQLGATVVAMGRSPSKLQRLQEELPGVETVVADFSDLDSVAQASQQIVERFDKIDVLLNNAGIHTGFRGNLETGTTKQGWDLAWGVNYLSHFLLTEKLMPLLKSSRNPKVVQVSSRFHLAVDGSDVSTFAGAKDPIASKPGGSHGFVLFRSQRQYANSKLAQILHARSLADKYGIRSVSACPTWVGTSILGAGNGTMAQTFFEKTAFDMNGFGLSSILHAILDTDNPSEDFYFNTDWGIRESFPLDSWPEWTYKMAPVRDAVVGSLAYTFVYFLQGFFPARTYGRSSGQTYNKTLQEELYIWSRQAVSQWL